MIAFSAIVVALIACFTISAHIAIVDAAGGAARRCAVDSHRASRDDGASHTAIAGNRGPDQAACRDRPTGFGLSSTFSGRRVPAHRHGTPVELDVADGSWREIVDGVEAAR
jgi:hypothetical protein